MPHSRVGWIKPITEEAFHDFAKIPSRNFEKTNLRGYVTHEDEKSINGVLSFKITNVQKISDSNVLHLPKEDKENGIEYRTENMDMRKKI